MVRRQILQGLAIVSTFGAARSGAAAPDAAAAAAERLLQAVGGRAAWAAARNTRNDSQQNRNVEPVVVRAVITMDFDAPRFRIDTTGPGLLLARVVDGERHWRRTRAGNVEPIAAEPLAEDRRWYAGHVYRTLHRIATGDARLAVHSPRPSRLEVHEAGARLAWYELDSRGEPYRFGAHDDDIGAICGPWDFEAGGIRHPLWTARPDGTWRATLRALEINVEMPASLLAWPG
jgi:hypothetical protein